MGTSRSQAYHETLRVLYHGSHECPRGFKASRFQTSKFIMFHPLNDTIKMIVTWPHDITMLPWWVKMHGFIQSLSSWIVMNHAEPCWMMLNQSESSCADRESLRCSRTWDLGSGVIRAVQSPRQSPRCHGSNTFSIHVFHWDSVRFYIRQDLLDGVGVVASVRIVSPKFMSKICIWTFPGIFVAHRRFCFLHTTVLFWWLAATLRFRGFLCFDALLLQAWSRVSASITWEGTDICDEHNIEITLQIKYE